MILRDGGPGSGALRRQEAGALLRHGSADRVVLGLALAQGLLGLAVLAAGAEGRLPSWAVALWVAIGLWWCSNTIAHIQIHTPLFRRRRLNRAFNFYLTGLMGLPQSLWRARHLWHHAGEPRARAPRVSARMLAPELALVLAVWAAIAWASPGLFLGAWLPGWLMGLMLCGLHGHFEHAGANLADDPGVSCYRRAYNRLWLNDGFHAEHHRWPSLHWSRLPERRLPAARASRWPPVLRWLDGFGATANRLAARILDRLERPALGSRLLQDWLLDRHGRALERVLAPSLAGAPPPARVIIVGGGLFPRTVLCLRRLLPDAELEVIESQAAHIDAARAWLAERDLPAGGIHFRLGDYAAEDLVGADLAVFPLGFRGDRSALYREPPARLTLIHDWIWRRRGDAGTVVSPLLLKRLNRVERGPNQLA